MTLLHELYDVREATVLDGQPHYSISLNPAHIIYQAHFPGQPVTPGVCIVQMVKEILELHLGQPLTLREVKNVKFLSVIQPKDGVCLDVAFSRIKAEADCVSASAVVTEGEEVMTKLSFTCRQA